MKKSKIELIKRQHKFRIGDTVLVNENIYGDINRVGVITSLTTGVLEDFSFSYFYVEFTEEAFSSGIMPYLEEELTLLEAPADIFKELLK